MMDYLRLLLEERLTPIQGTHPDIEAKPNLNKSKTDRTTSNLIKRYSIGLDACGLDIQIPLSSMCVVWL